MTTEKELERIREAYYSGLKVQIWFNGYWEKFDAREYSMYSDPFSKNRKYRIVGSDYAEIAEKHIKELEQENAELEGKLKAKEIEAHYCIPNCSQLTEAKSYIKYFVGILKNLGADKEELVTEAEAFLKE